MAANHSPEREDAARWLRMVNLAEVLQEEAQAACRAVALLPDDKLRGMTEAQVRAHFAGAAAAAGGAIVANHAPAAPPAEEMMSRWFPGLQRSGTRCANPRLRVVCFPSAGNAEDMFTSEGTGTRRSPNPLLEWCRANQAELWAVQPPGRAGRAKEPPATSARDLAQQLFDQVLAHHLLPPSLPLQRNNGRAEVALGAAKAGKDGSGGCVPWVVVSHSVGCWVAYELLRICQAAGASLPRAWCLSAMPAPDIPAKERPWRRQAELDEQQFMEECRAWDINEVVFSAGMWPMYQPLLRADFRLFDEYEHVHCPIGGTGGVEPFEGLPLHCWWGRGDRRVTEGMVQGWRRFSTGPVRVRSNPGNHLWPLNPTHKRQWLDEVVEVLDV